MLNQWDEICNNISIGYSKLTFACKQINFLKLKF